MPFYAGALDLPDAIQKADILRFDRNSLWMAFNYVANYAMLKYSYMTIALWLERIFSHFTIFNILEKPVISRTSLTVSLMFLSSSLVPDELACF